MTLTANRVAALSTWLTAFASLIAAFAGVLPQSWQNFALAAIAILTKLLTTWKFLSGAQAYDQLVTPKTNAPG